MSLKQGIDHIGNSVVYFCHDGRGEFVMAKRNANTRDEHGVWDIGGGGIDFGQTALDALRREIKEEYCTDVLDYEFLGFRDVHRINKEGIKTHWIALDFKVLVDREKVKIGEPHKFEGIGWFTLNTRPKEHHSQFPEFLERYRDRL